MDKKYIKLILSIILDAIGYFTFIPIDIAWAPISGFLMTRMYKGSKGKIAGIVSLLEEIIPFLDIFPSFTIMWVYTYMISKDKDDENETKIIEV